MKVYLHRVLHVQHPWCVVAGARTQGLWPCSPPPPATSSGAGMTVHARLPDTALVVMLALLHGSRHASGSTGLSRLSEQHGRGRYLLEVASRGCGVQAGQVDAEVVGLQPEVGLGHDLCVEGLVAEGCHMHAPQVLQACSLASETQRGRNSAVTSDQGRERDSGTAMLCSSWHWVSITALP